jgi:hypothetical protein
MPVAPVDPAKVVVSNRLDIALQIPRRTGGKSHADTSREHPDYLKGFAQSALHRGQP